MKQALQDRFADFLRLFAPDTAAALDLDAGVTFRDAETFTDLPQGALLIPDIVAEVRTRSGAPRLIIVHVEIQREREDEDFACHSGPVRASDAASRGGYRQRRLGCGPKRSM